MTTHILVLHGPNLNLLGEREPAVYGTETLMGIDQALQARGKALGWQVECFQSNHEGALVDAIQAARATTQGLIINPGGLTHTSVVLRDALAAYTHPILEVHLSNIYRREEFRHHSYVSPVATGVLCGLGPQGYVLALEAMANLLGRSSLS
jgi:3-dehydroquinate dehydratase-2